MYTATWGRQLAYALLGSYYLYNPNSDPDNSSIISFKLGSSNLAHNFSDSDLGFWADMLSNATSFTCPGGTVSCGARFTIGVGTYNRFNFTVQYPNYTSTHTYFYSTLYSAKLGATSYVYSQYQILPNSYYDLINWNGTLSNGNMTYGVGWHLGISFVSQESQIPRGDNGIIALSTVARLSNVVGPDYGEIIENVIGTLSIGANATVATAVFVATFISSPGDYFYPGTFHVYFTGRVDGEAGTYKYMDLTNIRHPSDQWDGEAVDNGWPALGHQESICATFYFDFGTLDTKYFYEIP